jgi:AcrR family transcriptional regulator
VKEPTRRSREKAARRGQLLAAASRLFAERGFRAVSIEDLAADAGVSGPALYRHFDSKESILADLLINVSERLLREGSRLRRDVDVAERRASLAHHVPH